MEKSNLVFKDNEGNIIDPQPIFFTLPKGNKKYALFFAPAFEAKCGWRDFQGWFDDIEKCAEAIPRDQGYWWQIVDTESWEIVGESYNEDFVSGKKEETFFDKFKK
jgi:hypothetical protein